MRHGQIASPTRTKDGRFPSADRRTFQLRANKQYANIARHNLAALFHTVGREFRIHTPTPALRRAAPRTRTETRRQAEMRHSQIASPTRTEDTTFPPPIVAPFQLRANKQYANIARHNLAALFHTAGQEFRIHTPTPALRHAAQCRRWTSAAMLPTITSPRRRRWQTMRHYLPHTSERRPARPENDGRAGQSPKNALSRNYNADLFAIRPES